MTALVQNVVAELKARIAELEQQLQASTAANARLSNEAREALEQQTAASEVLRIISSSGGDLAPVFDTMLGKAMQLCGADFGVLNTYDGERFETAATRGLPPAYDEYRGSRPLHYGPGTAPVRLLQGEPYVELVDLMDSEAYRTGEPNRRALVDLGGARAVLAVPLVKDDRVVGNVMIFRQENRRFSDKQISLLKQFAAQAVIAIENTRLLRELRTSTDDLRESLQQQTATADVLKVISRSAFDLQAVLETLIKSAVELSGANRGSIFLREGDVFPLKAASSTTPEFLQYWAANPPRSGRGSATSRVIASGRVEIIPDVLDDAEMQMPAGSLVKIRAALGVPMLRDNKVEGVLVLTRPEPGPFTKSQIDLVQTFADQAVIAVENARLFEQVQAKTRDLEESLQQQTATADVLKVISRSAFDLQAVLDTLVESAARLCEADMAAITRKSGEVFYRAGSYGFPHEFVEYARSTPVNPERRTITGRTLLEGRIVHVHDVLADPEYDFEGQQLSGNPRTFLGVPLLREGTPIGALTLTRSVIRPFSDSQIELVSTFADQAVIAIENARLFDEVQQRTAELSKSLEDLRATQDRLVQTEKLASLGQLTAGIAHEIKNPLNFVNNFAALSSELIDELNELLQTTALNDKTREDVGELTHLLKDNLQKVVQHGKRADSIVKNMLLHSREGSGEHRPTDVNTLVEESLNLAYHGARAEKSQFNVTIERDLDPSAGTIEVFPQEITRVLLNLISNGFYAVVTRKAESGTGDYEPALIAQTRGHDSHVEIRIRDNGTGIPVDVRKKMFTPFFTTKPAGEGTGLGLSMSHDIIVKQHGGTIDVETLPGEFTEFTIRLPRKSNFHESRG
ncbi:GAF domain-containing protein [Bradyrhizobium sp. DASA03076]|uniref:GAF domain-containing sensor histidine kinase n=1 Tax=Bradyrhizobium sp. BLXBL-03 TaxID=3395916 RepID=UPI003F702931